MDEGPYPLRNVTAPTEALARTVVDLLALLLQPQGPDPLEVVEAQLPRLSAALGARLAWVSLAGKARPALTFGTCPDRLPGLPDGQTAAFLGQDGSEIAGQGAVHTSLLALEGNGRRLGLLGLGGIGHALAAGDRALLVSLASGVGGALGAAALSSPPPADPPLSDVEGRLRATLSAMPELVLEVDLDGRCIDLHCSAPDMLAGPTDRIIGNLIEETIPPEVARLQRAGMARALRKGVVHLRPYCIRHDSRDAWYHTTIAPRMGREGCTGFVFRIRDATQDHERASELAMLGEVTQSMPNQALVLDADCRIIWANRAVEEKAGMPLARFRGRSIWDLADPSVPSQTVAAIRRAFDSRQPLRVDVAKTNIRGEPIWVDLSIQPIHTGGVAARGFTLIESDITELKRHEAALEQMARAAEQAHARLYSAIESLPDGLVYFDAEDRLVLCNARYRDFFPHTGHRLVPGVRFDDFLREALAAGEFPEAAGREEAWLADRLANHLLPEFTTEFHLSGGRVIRAHERQTPEGGRVGQRIDVTDLRRAEARLQDVLASARLGIWEFDCVRATTRYNGQWLEMLGLPESLGGDLTPELWASLIHPADRDKLADMTRAMRRGDLADFEGEFRMRHDRGHWVHILARGKVIHRDAQGKPLQVSGIGIDMTERRQTEGRLRAILEASSVGTWQLDCENGSVVIDEQYAAMLGYRLDEVLPWTHERFESLVHPDDLDGLRNRVSGLYGSDSGSVAHEFRIRHRDGHYIWILSQARVQRWSSPGVAAEESGLHIDITERKEREFALAAAKQALEEALAAQRASEQRYADIVAVSDEWFWEVAPDHTIRHLTSGFERTTGIGVQALVGQSLDRLVRDSADRSLQDDWNSLVERTRRRETLNGFLLKLPARGERPQIWLRISGSPFNDPAGTYAGYRGAGTNVSALIAATERAEAASEAKSRFLANMSHELRTPLTGVLGMAELLAETDVSDRQRGMIDTIRTSGEGLLTILNDILDLAKIEAGKMVVESQPYSPAEVIGRVEALFAPRAATADLALSVPITPELATPRQGDSNRLLQILTNLVGNAIKFTTEGSVTLQARIDPAPRPTLVITVTDTGIGMSADQLARVFEEFEQAETSTARRFGGTGLGLSITRRLVALMGGSIDMRSDVGKGTCVTLILPAPLATPSVPSTPEAPPAQRPTRSEGLRILVADDNQTNRRILETMLSGLGARVSLARDGHAACALFTTGAFDGLMLDISMPGLDGIETLTRIRAIEAAAGTAPVPAVAVTANAMQHQVDAYRVAGFDDHVAKPFRKESLARALDLIAAGRATVPATI